jgi:ribosomal protein S10
MKITYKIRIDSFYQPYIKKFLKVFIVFLANTINLLRTRAKVSLVYLPTSLRRFTVLRSPHINKKSKEQFESKKYSVNLYIQTLKGYKKGLKNPIIGSPIYALTKFVNMGKNLKFLPIKIKIKQTVYNI